MPSLASADPGAGASENHGTTAIGDGFGFAARGPPDDACADIFSGACADVLDGACADASEKAKTATASIAAANADCPIKVSAE
jgi:hypothetical protein